MNVRKFMRDQRVGRNDYNTAEAAEYLDIEAETLRYFVRMGVIKPVEGGGRGQSFYFTVEQIEKLEKQIASYY